MVFDLNKTDDKLKEFVAFRCNKELLQKLKQEAEDKEIDLSEVIRNKLEEKQNEKRS